MTKTTEKHNKNSLNLDLLTTYEILKVINNEDSKVPDVIKNQLGSIVKLIDDIVPLLKNGGKLYYVGCGTSGRLGVLDAAECPPTFGVDNNMINGIIAGGYNALIKSVEGAEDSQNDGTRAIVKKNISNLDTVIGISASSTAAFVNGAMKESYKRGALTGFISCNKIKRLSYIKHSISLVVGPEVITGSTRMKAGTATKLILNMISTTIMVRLNKTYGNIMVDLKVSNNKLLDRGVRIVSEITNLSYDKSKIALNNAKGTVKIAIIMVLLDIDYKDAKIYLDNNNGKLRDVIEK